MQNNDKLKNGNKVIKAVSCLVLRNLDGVIALQACHAK